jgi:hypothetical protein
MLTKFLIAVIAILVGWVLVRYLSQPRSTTPAKADAPKTVAPGDKVTTLERDPKTGIYR